MDDVANITRDLEWKDKFFREEEGFIAVFDFDYENIIKYDNQVCVAVHLCPLVCIFSSLFCWPCVMTQNNEWQAYAKHLAVTRDGIKYVEDKQKTGYGLASQDQGKTTKTVPFDKITDCDVVEPAGAECFCVERILYTVNVDTASGRSGGEGGPMHELELTGLHNPYVFKKLVWAMKRQYNAGGPQAAVFISPPKEMNKSQYNAGGPQAAVFTSPPKEMNMARDDFTKEDTYKILRKIQKELKIVNKNLEKMQK